MPLAEETVDSFVWHVEEYWSVGVEGRVFFLDPAGEVFALVRLHF